MKLLMLTSHTTHKSYDSVYALPKAIKANFPDIGVYTTSLDISVDHFNEKTSVVEFVEIDDGFSFDRRNDYYIRGRMQQCDIADFDVIFFRIDRIVDDPDRLYKYFAFVERCAPNAQYVNSPAGLIATSSKRFLENFPDLCPDFRIVNSLNEAIEEAQKYPIVLKPLGGYGGYGIIKVASREDISVEGKDKSGEAAKEYLESLPDSYFPVMAMRYLHNVTQGDKRVIVVAGVCLGAVLRVPRAGNWMANLAQGATSEFAEPDQDELAIIDRVDPVLRDIGITVYGIDTLVDDSGKRALSEINTTNVGGFVQIEANTGRPILNEFAQLIIHRLGTVE